MNAIDSTELLVEEGVIELHEASEQYKLSTQVQEELDDLEKSDNNLREGDVLDSAGSLGHRIARRLESQDEWLKKLFLLLRSWDLPISVDEHIPLLFLVDQFVRGFPERGGTPKSFFPLRGDQLDAFTSLNSVSIVYIWRDECPPCDQMSNILDELFPTPPKHFPLVAVYGQLWPNVMAEYDVVGAPTTLFTIENEVDARLEGTHPREVLDCEVDKITRDLPLSERVNRRALLVEERNRIVE